jgi:hypothetical protein
MPVERDLSQMPVERDLSQMPVERILNVLLKPSLTNSASSSVSFCAAVLRHQLE